MIQNTIVVTGTSTKPANGTAWDVMDDDINQAIAKQEAAGYIVTEIRTYAPSATFLIIFVAK